MLVRHLLERSAARCPDNVALVSGSRRLTYADVNARSDQFATALLRAGLRRGDRVVLHLENGPEAVAAIFGTVKAGGVFVPVNPTVKDDKLAYILNDCSATIMLTDRAPVVATAALAHAPGVSLGVFADGREHLTGGDDRIVELSEFLADTGESPLCAPRVIDLDLAALIYTSGSSGRPKGVALTHLNMTSAAASIDEYLQNTADDVILCALPLSFDYGLYQIFLAFQSSARLVLERSFVYPKTVLEVLEREHVTALPVVPMMAALLLRHDLAAHNLSTLRYITNTGAVLPPSYVSEIRARLPHVRIFSMYGLTECKRVSYLAPEEIDQRPTSVGKPMDNVEVYLLDGQGRRTDSGVGQLVVRGSNVMQGYWNSPEETARVLSPGPVPGEQVLHTGDIFSIDADGYMYFLSRTDDVIKSRGQKVSPREIEDVLYAMPAVQEAAVVGIPHPMVGEAIKAYVTLREGFSPTEQDILQHCAKHLEDFMVPRAVEIVTDLPRTGSGKVARRPLKAGTAS